MYTVHLFVYYFTPRFYNRLPEVRRKRLEEKRSATYESNRKKAKIYQEVHSTCMHVKKPPNILKVHVYVFTSQQVRAKMQKKPLKIPIIFRKPPFK